MEGVTILNEFEVVTETIFNWSAFWTGVLIGLSIAFIAGIIFGLKENSFSAFITMFLTVSIVAPFLIGFFAGSEVCPEPVAYETHYELFLDGNVNMKEFMDKYEIIEVQGSIYTVKEK